jgi:hypothetical protein
MTTPVDSLVDRAQAELESALHGASLCAVSRDPSAGATTVKYLEGRWYTLRDIQRRLEAGEYDSLSAAADDVEAENTRRTPNGDAWRDYTQGAASALADVRGLIG